MRKTIYLFIAIMTVTLFASCERVAPNYAGVLMENYGKDGKTDFSIVSGKVSTWEWGTELFQVPLFDQRGAFAEAVILKAADNTEFKACPVYSYKVIKDRAIDVVFDNKHIGSFGDFMSSLEDNILEPRIYDLIKEESRKYKTDTLMADGGSLAFEKNLEQIVRKEFEDRGLELRSFSAQLEFSDKVREKIDSRNEVNTNISVLDQQIEEQKKRNELEQLRTEQALIQSRGLTKEILQKQFIDKWDGKTPLYGVVPDFLKLTK
ncbi:SPFH domain-containing protein [Bacteroides caecigallinarum]|uniref:SPFH domain-containing protein n=1 Tax=Bacteroides caecigallinarum TaxID=1411144 RepID=UPI001EF5FBBA|nr:SPFH domain-containing protein [Bacteroides caecigallinarum]